MIGDSLFDIDTDGNITIKGTVFRGKEVLWELLTRRTVNIELINKDVLKTYKKFIMTNEHLKRYQPGDNINVTRGKKFHVVNPPRFANPKGRVVTA